MAHVVILVHRHESFDDEPYFLREMAGFWREAGHRVNVRQGPDDAPVDAADVAVLHVDLTRVPADHLDFVRRFRVAINVGVADISKRAISENLVAPGDGYDGPVIVKTTWNSGGMREKLLARRGPIAARVARWARDALPWYRRSRLATGDYRILDTPAGVPRAAWRNPNLVVERFQPERRDELYCLRTWMFFGDRETNSICYSKTPIVKSRTVVRREPVAEIPDELRAIRRRLGFDYGKFDYAIVGGRVVLYDANRTPTTGTFHREQFLPRVKQLADGLEGFL